jgi:putative flavoprotein involved in K+ transport
VAATGPFSTPRLPAVARQVPPGVLSLHAADYRRPEALPPGGVLVVGGAQTGTQIAEDLADAGRRVFLATSRVGRVRRRYRGRDFLVWWRDAGFYDRRRIDMKDTSVFAVRQPLITGVAGGHTLSLQLLTARGVTLLGRLAGLEGSTAFFADDLAANVDFADAFSRRERAALDTFIDENGLDAPPAEPDAADEPGDVAPAPAFLDLAREGVGTIVWATGFAPSLEWLRVPGAHRAEPLRDAGLDPAPGVFLLGVPWLTHRASGIVLGAARDASAVAERIAAGAGT